MLEAQPGPKAGLRSKTAHRILGAFGSYRTTSAICSRFKTSEALRRLSSFLYGSTHASLAPCLSECWYRRMRRSFPHTRGDDPWMGWGAMPRMRRRWGWRGGAGRVGVGLASQGRYGGVAMPRMRRQWGWRGGSCQFRPCFTRSLRQVAMPRMRRRWGWRGGSCRRRPCFTRSLRRGDAANAASVGFAGRVVPASTLLHKVATEG